MKTKKHYRLFLATRTQDIIFVSEENLVDGHKKLEKQALFWFNEQDDGEEINISEITNTSQIPDDWRDGGIWGMDDEQQQDLGITTPDEFLSKISSSTRLKELESKLDSPDFREFLKLQRVGK